MKTKHVYQADAHGFYLYQAIAHELALSPGIFNVPYLAYEDAPQADVPEGMVAMRNASKTAWDVVEDHRTTALFYLKNPATEDNEAVFEQYQIGTEIEIDGQQVSYVGGGPIPDWLTDTAPERAQPPLLDNE